MRMHCSSVSVSCALMVKSVQANASVDNSLFMFFISFIRCKGRLFRAYERYDIFALYVHIFRFCI